MIGVVDDRLLSYIFGSCPLQLHIALRSVSSCGQKTQDNSHIIRLGVGVKFSKRHTCNAPGFQNFGFSDMDGACRTVICQISTLSHSVLHSCFKTELHVSSSIST